MTTAADDPAVEEAFEAYLAGRPAPGAAGLVSFADAVRASATEPGRPNAALAELLANGLLVDQPGPAQRPARRPRRRRTRMLAAALFTKIASAGLAAKAATVTGIAVVGLTTVGFTGNLGPVQHPFATLVDHTTPFTAPDPATATATDLTPADEPVTTPPVTSPTGTATETATETPEAPTTADPTVPANETTEPSETPAEPTQAHPSNYGGLVSQWAHDRNRDRKAGATTVRPKPSKPASVERSNRSGSESPRD